MAFEISETAEFRGNSEYYLDGINLVYMWGKYHDELEKLLNQYESISGRQLGSQEVIAVLKYIGCEYLSNGFDSIVERFVNGVGEEYVGILEMRLKLDEEKVRFEVEDNGTGIDLEIEGSLFQSCIDSKKRQDMRTRGQMGQGLYNARIQFDHINGAFGFENFGRNKGAMFWYEVPTSSL